MKIWLALSLLGLATAQDLEKRLRQIQYIIPPTLVGDTLERRIDGKTYTEWSEAFWKWLLRMPTTDHPAFDETGELCDDDQTGSVWFFPGAFTNEEPTSEFNTVVREACTIPRSTKIFFPFITTSCTTAEVGTIWELTADNEDSCATKFLDGSYSKVTGVSLKIDDNEVVLDEDKEDYRAKTGRFALDDFEDPADNMLGVNCSTPEELCKDIEAVSDGHWIMLRPLLPGDHTIQWTARYDWPNGTLRFGMDVKYEVTVLWETNCGFAGLRCCGPVRRLLGLCE
jgi:hypothetical protein